MLPSLDQRLRVEGGRVLEVVVPHERAHPGARCRGRHLLGLLERHPEGFLAVDMLSRRDRGERHFVVQ